VSNHHIQLGNQLTTITPSKRVIQPTAQLMIIRGNITSYAAHFKYMHPQCMNKCWNRYSKTDDTHGPWQSSTASVIT